MTNETSDKWTYERLLEEVPRGLDFNDSFAASMELALVKLNALEERARENEEKAKLATECAEIIRYHADCKPDDTGWCCILEESRYWLSRYDQFTKREE